MDSKINTASNIKICDWCNGEYNPASFPQGHCVMGRPQRRQPCSLDELLSRITPENVHGTLEAFQPSTLSGLQDSTYSNLGKNIGELVFKKEQAYGEAWKKSAAHLRILFPESIPVDRYEDVLLIVRILDKITRIATHKRDAGGEDPWDDLVGYGLIGASRSRK